jgi:hypothetical protein
LPEGEKISHVGLRMGESEIGDVTWHVNKVCARWYSNGGHSCQYQTLERMLNRQLARTPAAISGLEINCFRAAHHGALGW